MADSVTTANATQGRRDPLDHGPEEIFTLAWRFFPFVMVFAVSALAMMRRPDMPLPWRQRPRRLTNGICTVLFFCGSLYHKSEMLGRIFAFFGDGSPHWATFVDDVAFFIAYCGVLCPFIGWMTLDSLEVIVSYMMKEFRTFLGMLLVLPVGVGAVSLAYGLMLHGGYVPILAILKVVLYLYDSEKELLISISKTDMLLGPAGCWLYYSILFRQQNLVPIWHAISRTGILQFLMPGLFRASDMAKCEDGAADAGEKTAADIGEGEAVKSDMEKSVPLQTT